MYLHPNPNLTLKFSIDPIAYQLPKERKKQHKA